MAEIRIEKKKTLWPWLLGVLILAGLIYFIVLLTNTSKEGSELSTIESLRQAPPLVEDLTAPDLTKEATAVSSISENDAYSSNNESPVTTEKTLSENSGKVIQYIAYITDPDKMSLDHEYSNQSLLLLIDAVKEVADAREIDLSVNLREAKESADIITKDPYAVNHADHIKKAATTISAALQTIQEQSFESLGEEINILNRKVNAIAPGTEALNQKKDIKSYFDQAAIVLTKMKMQ